MEVGGVSVGPAIDAVFERVSGGQSFLVVDWKSGRPVRVRRNRRSWPILRTQLRLYRRAWAARMGVDPSGSARWSRSGGAVALHAGIA